MSEKFRHMHSKQPDSKKQNLESKTLSGHSNKGWSYFYTEKGLDYAHSKCEGEQNCGSNGAKYTNPYP